MEDKGLEEPSIKSNEPSEKVTGRRDAPPDVGDSLFRPQPKDDPI